MTIHITINFDVLKGLSAKKIVTISGLSYDECNKLSNKLKKETDWFHNIFTHSGLGTIEAETEKEPNEIVTRVKDMLMQN